MVNKDKYKIFFDLLENNFQIAESVAKKFVEFCEIIQQSNEHFNLTSIKKMDDMLIKHILDSLSIQHLVSGRKILDIGTGAGLPGVPLALVNTESDFFLLDSNNKKIIFLNHVKISLGIENIFPEHERVENLDGKRSFDTIVCRSFSSLAKIYLRTKNLKKNEGKIIAMKGKFPKDELAELKTLDSKIRLHVEKLKIPGLEADRHAVIIY